MENTNNDINKIKKKSTIREYAEALAIAVILALFIRTFIIQAFKIPSGSMKSTLLIGDHLLVNKFIYGIRVPFIDKHIIQFKKPERGDVVVFKWPEDESKDFIKRVVGIEGDIIEIKDDTLYVNNERIEHTLIDKFSDESVRDADVFEEVLDGNRHFILDQIAKKENYGPVTVPENSIFVMGDNRDNSQDSRYWENESFVKLEKIKGKALIIYWSWSNWKSWPRWKRFLKIIR
ncbi:signal peptidase I [Thermodesulfobacteriota bacterium]